MRIILGFIYFIIFIILATGAMFLGGVSGVSGTFYLMVEPGDLEMNLIKMMTILVGIWILVVFLRSSNKRAIKRNKFIAQEMENESDSDAKGNA